MVPAGGTWTQLRGIFMMIDKSGRGRPLPTERSRGWLHIWGDPASYCVMWRRGGISGCRFEDGEFAGWLSGDPWFERGEPEMRGGGVSRNYWVGNLEICVAYPTKAARAAHKAAWDRQRAESAREEAEWEACREARAAKQAEIDKALAREFGEPIPAAAQ